MEEESVYLFVYGTLQDEQNEFAIYLKQNCSFYGKGRFKGKLYDLGEYPGAILDEKGDNYVYGSILNVKNISEVLIRLDEYEGFGEEEDRPNLFIREIVSIETNNGKVVCLVYLYNLSVDGFKTIDSGDYAVYKKPDKL
jgi:gamma-glutamylcyclotransferase (GGCT)/AIG2-like uncharacterized protein YtfP